MGDAGLSQSAVATDTPVDIDVVIVGAGFGGVYLLHKLRDEHGLRVKIFETANDLGGIWYWNCYPGARVDSEVPVYEYSLPKVYKDWTWSCKYPGFAELQRYFDHVEKVLNVKKDVFFGSTVVGAEFDPSSKRWHVRMHNGRSATAKYLLIATGFAAKRHYPGWKGLDSFNGVVHHSSFWPHEGVDMKGKKVAVVGTGSTGIQLAQECAADAAELTLFQRTPNLALPMKQGPLTIEQQDKKSYPQFFSNRSKTATGFAFDVAQKNTFDDTPEQREAFFEELWQAGGFKFWLGGYKDMLYDNKANKQAYDFWAKKTRARIQDPVKRDILAPLDPPHAFGTKRPSLEQNFYEHFNNPNVHIIDIKANPVVEVQSKGIVTADGKLHELDIIALATGFDSVTGGMRNMGLKATDGLDLADKWKMGVWTYLGMTCNGFPNMFFLYGAQGPTAFSNGPSCVECQGDWIVDAITKMEANNIKSIEATKEAEQHWKRTVNELSDMTLFPQTDSWYMGANIPGKPREQLNFTGGFPLYNKKIRSALEDWSGFEVLS
jgi:cation diffusion facilitator CzcD-associated flavoprotein CzcO